jgi:hypothetical protein
VNFPFIWSSIRAPSVYGVYISPLIRYSRACDSYKDFLDRELLLTRKLLNQTFLLDRWMHHFDILTLATMALLTAHGIAVSQMTTNMFYLSYTLSVLSSFMTDHWFCIYQYATSGTSGAGTACPSGAPDFTHGFMWGSCFSISSFMYNVFVDRCLYFSTFSVHHCVDCSLIYGFWLHLLHLQALPLWHVLTYQNTMFAQMLLIVWLSLIYCWKCCPLSLICHCKLNFYE